MKRGLSSVVFCGALLASVLVPRRATAADDQPNKFNQALKHDIEFTGTLTAVGPNGGAVSTGTGPVAFTIRSDGSTSGNFWVFASNLGANTISTFFLNGATGGLSALPQLTVPGDGAPHGIVAH